MWAVVEGHQQDGVRAPGRRDRRQHLSIVQGAQRGQGRRDTHFLKHDGQQLAGVLAVAVAVGEDPGRAVRRVIVFLAQGDIADIAPQPVG